MHSHTSPSSLGSCICLTGWAWLQGHLADVAQVCWTRDDSRLVSIGGCHLYHWNAATWQRMPDEELCDKTMVGHTRSRSFSNRVIK